MKITIYSKEKGLHNPYDAKTEGGPHVLANFLILCMSKVCVKHGITEHQLFSTSRKGELPNLRGAIMNFLYKNKKFKRSWNMSCNEIAHIFSKDHSTVLHFCKPESSIKGGERGYMKTKRDVWSDCEKVLSENKFNLVNCEAMIFSYQEFLDFAYFIGASEEKLKDFIKLRA